ncbi:RHS repeat domain-containing protein [Pseudomonas putida]|uniref:RHS repeat domain-containing protein n=1 Tax=Pseudomonas putida TaxID=303 RepID=UPI002365F56D|nr:RHS repeat-associated core domain-containing protein [Pseudomonas putida]MDD2046638.1 RHS repeat-associated core domain-containing protein [Pseudomonas putida]
MKSTSVTNLHFRTPTLISIDPRGLPIITVGYHRLSVAEKPQARIERQLHNAARQLSCQWDTRLWADGGDTGVPNQSTLFSLSSQALCSDSVDSGWKIAMFGDAGQSVEDWDGRGGHRETRYDYLIRPISVYEQMGEGARRCVERFAYGDAAQTAANRCGRVIRQDDTAGSQEFPAYGLLGQCQVQTQWFLGSLETPDWPDTVTARDELLEHNEQGTAMSYTTRWQHDALGAALHQTDAAGNVQSCKYDVAGQLLLNKLKPLEEGPTTVVRDIVYNAFGQVTSQLLGNGATTTANYSAVDGRLEELRTIKANKVLQALSYNYDPVGNVLSVLDTAQPTDWFNGEQVNPMSVYRYDTLYQLVEASGRESLQAIIQPGLPDLRLPGGGDTSRRRNYTQRFEYDASGNLLTLKHDQLPTRVMKVDPRSNRSLYQADAANPPDISQGFDANGNMLCMQSSQELYWNVRNQLQRVTHVARQGGASDNEVYVYGAGDQRRRKVRVRQARTVEHVSEVRYLPGLEIRWDTATGEVMHNLTVQAGRSQVRLLRWRASRRTLPSPQWRYGLHDHLGSSTLELDHDGTVISHEGFYPFGGTAWWAARSEVDVQYKVIRYTGKERDTTGLYYYGYRYYAPWLNRWLNPDPAGDINGLNVYKMCGNNPTTHFDNDGRHWPMSTSTITRSPSRIVTDIESSTVQDQQYPPLGLDARPGVLWGDSSEFLDSAHAYFIADFNQKAEKIERRLDHVSKLLSDEFVHTINPVDPYEVTSVHKNGLDSFTNAFTPERWVLKSNYKSSKVSEYHANDVIRHQYKLISKGIGFYGTLPSVIENRFVVSRPTNEIGSRFSSKSPALLKNFLTQTPIGKGTLIALNDFGMEPLWVDYQKDSLLFSATLPVAHLYLGVRPISRPQTSQRLQRSL